MAWYDKAQQLLKRYGAPAKFAAKLILGATVPGSPAVIELIQQALDCAHETTKDNLDATPADLARLESALDVLLGEFQPLMDKLRRLEPVPDIAREMLETALATDEACHQSARLLEQCVGQFDRLGRQHEQMLAGQEEMLPILRRMVGVCDYVDELRAAGCAPQAFAQFLGRFSQAYEAFAGRQYAEADRLLTAAAAEQPQSAAVTVALAATQTVEHQFVRAEGTLARAVRLRPTDAELVELHRRVTVLSRRGNTPTEPPAGPAAPQPGDLLDGWKLEQLLGRGGWGQVYKATRDGKARALKVMHPELAQDSAFVDRFKREIKALMKLDRHAGLVEIDTFGFDRGSWYFVMDFVEGVALETHLGRHGALSWEQARPLFVGIAEGLALAYARGIVHRDIKPANIMLRPDGTGVLVDFGLAGLVDASGQTGRAGYTPLFAAPEQLRGGQADARADLYSLAATLYYSLLYDDPARREPHYFKAGRAPEAVRDLLTRSLDNDPAERPADAGVLAGWLTQPPESPLEQDMNDALEQMRTKGDCQAYIERQGPSRIGVWHVAAEKGDAHAQWLLSRCLYQGAGIEKSAKAGLSWLRKAAEAGLPVAQTDLGNCFYNGTGVKVNADEAFRLYTAAAQKGFPEAEADLGDCHYYGKGAEKDLAEAARHYRKAADAEWSRGQDSLGDCYFEGEGVTQDYSEAIKLYRKAAEQGLANAQNTLGWCYDLGKGVNRNWSEAANWYRKAADQGYDDSQCALGYAFEHGYGIEPDIVQAERWYRKAADQGQKWAKHALARPPFGEDKKVPEHWRRVCVALDLLGTGPTGKPANYTGIRLSDAKRLSGFRGKAWQPLETAGLISWVEGTKVDGTPAQHWNVKLTKYGERVAKEAPADLRQEVQATIDANRE
jgi:TPR repeat protein